MAACAGMSTNNTRITIRLPEDLYAWVEEQAAALALDAAAFVRMSLQQRRTGHVSAPKPQTVRGGGEPSIVDAETYQELTTAPVEDIVSQALDRADAEGTTAPRQPSDDSYGDGPFMRGVRAVSEPRQWDAFNAKSRAPGQR